MKMSRLKMNHSKAQDVITELSERLDSYQMMFAWMFVGLLALGLMVVASMTAIEIISHNGSEYNRGVCHAYGLQSDCQTPLNSKVNIDFNAKTIQQSWGL